MSTLETPSALRAPPAPSAARRLFAWFRGEFLHVLPVFVFFFLAFNFINETTWLMAPANPESHFAVSLLAVAAGIVAKVVLVIDHLPIMNAFAGRPRVLNIAWKTAIYCLAVLAVRWLEHLVRFAVASRSLSVGYARFVEEIPWNIFWAAQLWYAALFLVYVTFREMEDLVGPRRLRRELLGR
jgi:hypothetical protein